MKTLSPIALIILLATEPSNYAIWMLLLFAAGLCTYIFAIAGKENAPIRAATPISADKNYPPII